MIRQYNPERIFLFVLIILSASALFGQHTSFVYKITFADKANSVYTLDEPLDYLSQRAIERRDRYGISITEEDLPVSPAYIQSIEQQGARVLVKSKWLNMVIIETDNREVADRISGLEFVGNVTDASELIQKRSTPGDLGKYGQTKPFFETETYKGVVSQKNLQSTAAAFAFDYGLSLNQIDMINGTGLHNEGFAGEGMVIAVLDAGFWKVDSMPVFDSLWINGQILGTRNFVNPGESVFDPNIYKHGMMVLSIMGGNMPGLIVGTAPHADYYLIRTEDGTAEYLMEEYYWVMGAEYADSVGADVINSSLGYTTFDDPGENHTYADMDGNTAPVTIGADKAAERGILVSNSAGNSGGSPWLYIGAPADGDSVFSIGAVDALGNYALFSSIGPTSDGRVKPNVVAQGQETIIAAWWDWNAVTSGSGTSFSSPVIAGMSACLWQTNRDFNNMDVIQAIQQSASQYENPDYFLGFGIPDFQQAKNTLGAIEIHAEPFKLPLTIIPNPFNHSIQLRFDNHTAQTVRIEIYDMTGKLLINQSQAITGGDIMIETGSGQLSQPGLYFIRVVTGYGIYSGKALKTE